MQEEKFRVIKKIPHFDQNGVLINTTYILKGDHANELKHTRNVFVKDFVEVERTILN
jgi:hypothetical protein